MDYICNLNGNNVHCLEQKIFKDANKLGPTYNKFKDIDVNHKNRIQELSSSFYKSCSGRLMSQNYTNILNYLSTSYGKSKLCETGGVYNFFIPTYDEYLVFAISSCDPECKIFTTYLKCDSKMSYEYKKNMIRREVGFFSELLFRAEKDYYFKYVNNLIMEARVDNSSYLSLISNMITTFDDVSLERFDKIKELAILWNASVSEKHKYTTCLYNIVYQSKLLKLNSTSEKLLFLISAVDPELKLLSIYEEENKVDAIKNRSLEELGFYNQNLIKIEKIFKDKYMPDKKISEWSLINKR